MATVITLAGESLIARKQAAGEPLQIDAFVLALVPGLDPDLPVERSEGKPDAAQIVHTYQIPDEYRGYVNPNQVVYSMLLGSDLGNFSFNWLGLYSSADDVVVAISHLPEMAKWKTDTATNTAGNNLTRNMLLEFSGAQATTGITVQAATWQVDFTARMRGIDERERRSNRDIYGRACFFADAAKVVNNAGAFSLQAGTLYVEGVRAAFAAMPLEAGSLPKKVWLDVGFVQQGADMAADMAVTVLPPEQAAPDYADAVGNARYRVLLAEIAADGTVTDLRRTEGVVTDLVAYLLENGGAKEIKEHLESASPHGLPLAGGEPGQVLIKQNDGSIAWGIVDGTFTARVVLTTSGAWVAPVSGWYRIMVVGGGGGGGKGGAIGADVGGLGGGQGGQSSFDDIVASGGDGGGGGASNAAKAGYSGGGGGAGGPGEVVIFYAHLTKGQSCAIVIGAGGIGATATTGTMVGGDGAGPKGGKGGGQAWQGGQGAARGQSGDNATYGSVGGNGGNGSDNGTGYGGGGGGGGGSDPHFPNDVGHGGYGVDGASDGSEPTSTTNGGNGGNGGNGAVIIEYKGAA
jgi:hypothetical protein